MTTLNLFNFWPSLQWSTNSRDWAESSYCVAMSWHL